MNPADPRGGSPCVPAGDLRFNPAGGAARWSLMAHGAAARSPWQAPAGAGPLVARLRSVHQTPNLALSLADLTPPRPDRQPTVSTCVHTPACQPAASRYCTAPPTLPNIRHSPDGAAPVALRSPLFPVSCTGDLTKENPCAIPAGYGPTASARRARISAESYKGSGLFSSVSTSGTSELPTMIASHPISRRLVAIRRISCSEEWRSFP